MRVKEFSSAKKSIVSRYDKRKAKLWEVNQNEDEFETTEERTARKINKQDIINDQMNNEISILIKKFDNEYNDLVIHLIENYKKLSHNRFTITANDLIFKLSKYDPYSNTFKINIEKQPTINNYLKVVINDKKIKMGRQEAKIFKQHFNNDLLRPEIIGRVYSNGNFDICKVYIISDANNKNYKIGNYSCSEFYGYEYNLFSSK